MIIASTTTNKEGENMNKNKRIGCIRQYASGNEYIDWVFESDLISEDQEKKDLIQSWLFGLDEPWSDFACSYNICMNQRRTDENLKDLWKAEYLSIFYDGMESYAYGYGKTPEEALMNVKKLVEESIEKYYEGKDEDDE